MNIAYYLVLVLHIMACLFLIGVVLLQQGKSQDLASAFGGGGTQTAFGPRGSANVLSRATTILAAVFMITSLALTVLRPHGTSLLDRAAPTSSAPAAPAAPAATAAPAPAPPRPPAARAPPAPEATRPPAKKGQGGGSRRGRGHRGRRRQRGVGVDRERVGVLVRRPRRGVGHVQHEAVVPRRQ